MRSTATSRRKWEDTFFRTDVRFVAASVGEVERVARQFQPVVDERTHNGVFAETVGFVFYVVPEQIVCKRQTCKENVGEDVPAFEAYGFALYARENGQYGLRSVEFDRGKSAHIEVKLLIQEFEQSAVDAQVVGVDFDSIDGSRHAFLEMLTG